MKLELPPLTISSASVTPTRRDHITVGVTYKWLITKTDHIDLQYAVTTAALLEIPWPQWTSTMPPDLKAESMKRQADGR
jgi:hypothetical protein